MRLGDLDDLKVHISELILVYSGTELDNAILNAIDNAPTVCGNNPKWCENCVSKGKCASTRPHIIDNCDMNVFEPEKYIEGGAK